MVKIVFPGLFISFQQNKKTHLFGKGSKLYSSPDSTRGHTTSRSSLITLLLCDAQAS